MNMYKEYLIDNNNLTRGGSYTWSVELCTKSHFSPELGQEMDGLRLQRLKVCRPSIVQCQCHHLC